MFIKNFKVDNKKNIIQVSPNTHSYLSHIGFSPISFLNGKYIYLKTKKLLIAIRERGINEK